MIRVPLYVLGVLLAVICSCERHKGATEPLHNTPVTPTNLKALISYGTSFGECGGYCIRELKIDQLNITFTASSWFPQDHPDKILQAVIERKEYEQIQSLVDFDKLAAFDDVIGCPDCADGGAEWLQISVEDQFKKITFEKGATLATIQPLINKLRQMYADYNTQMFPVN